MDAGSAIYDQATVAGVACAEATEPPTGGCLPKETQDPTTSCTTGSIDNNVTLQYCYKGHWTGFCTLTHHEAMVACKQLGYTDYTCMAA